MSYKGEIVLEIAHSAGNSRNSEGAFINIKNNRIMYVYSKYTGNSWKDDSRACIAAIFSSDEGQTWSDDIVIATPEEHNTVNIMSVSLLRMLDGAIGLFYLVRCPLRDMRPYMRKSYDEGKSWSVAEPCTPCKGYYIVNNDRVIRLSTGRIIMPIAYSTMCKMDSGIRMLDGRASAYFLISDNDGVSWRGAHNSSVLLAKRSNTGLQEPGVIELSNGVLWAWCRTDLGRQYEIFSYDCGESWSIPEPSVFTSAISPLSMKRIPQTGHLIALWNPIPIYQTRKFIEASNGRTPLVLSLSKDDGRSWGEPVILEDEENSGFCYTAIHFTERYVILGYCAGGGADECCLTRLRIRRIPISNLTEL